MRVEILNREFYASITDVVRMAHEMELGERVWGKPLHSEAMKLPGLIKHEGAWFAPAFALAELVAGKPELSNFEETADQILLGAETARQKRREQAAKEREEAERFQQEAEERELKARKREETLEVIRKAQTELSEGLIRDEKEDTYQELLIRGMTGQEMEELDA